jgi:uncharacterized protein YndB with AHSA1/START domain
MLLTRNIGAPRRLVFEAWINPEHLAQWWGPDGFTSPRCELDVRPAGAIRIDMRAPDGTVYPIGGFYQEIVEFEKLVFSSSVLDSLGHPLVDVLNTVTFADDAHGTTLAVLVRVLRSTEESVPFLEAMEPSWKQSLERLRAYLALI